MHSVSRKLVKDFGWFVVLFLAAESTAEEQCDSITRVATIAAEYAPEVALARSRSDMAQAERAEVRSLWRPQLTGFTRTGIGDSGLVDSQIENQAGVRLSQRLIDFGDAKHRKKIATAKVSEMRADIEVQAYQSALRAGRLYLEALMYEQHVVQQKQMRQKYIGQSKVFEDLLTEGLITGFEYATLVTRLALIDSKIQKSVSEGSLAIQELQLLTGQLLRVCEYHVSYQLLQDALPKDIPDSAVVVTQAPSFRAAVSALESERARSSLAINSRLPIVNIGGVASYGNRDFENSGWTLRHRVGIDISVPLYSGRAHTSRVARSRAAVNAKKSKLAVVRQSLREQFTSARLSRQHLMQTIELLERAHSQLLHEQLLVQGEIAQGQGTIKKLLEVEERLEEAAGQLTDSRHFLAKANLQLASMLGLFGKVHP